MKIQSEEKVGRREFLAGAAGLSIAGAVCLNAWGEEKPAEPVPTSALARSKVVLVRNPEVLTSEGQVNAPVLARMLDDSVVALSGEVEPAAAWKGLFKPEDTVGIKTNVWQFLRTPPELEEAIRSRLVDAGVQPERIAIDDRGVLNNPVFQQATALINVRPMRSHHWAGVGSLLKNYIMFSPSPSSWHEDSCANLAGLWDLPVVKGKTRLNILVMLTPLFHGKGPHHYQKEYLWPYYGLIVGSDPVAVDATGLRILEAKRLAHFGQSVPFSIPPKHIQVAQDKYHLGVADPARIDLIRLGSMEGALI